MNLTQALPILRDRIQHIATASDPAHDFAHFERVVATAKRLAEIEGGDLNIILPAAWLHDFVIIPKNDPRRSQASRLSAEAAIPFLKEIGYDSQYFDRIAHAIEAHSFSAGIACQTLEAQIVQDADRLDGLGAIGIARCFATAGLLKRPFYDAEDPFCERREPDDLKYTVDHFYRKLFPMVKTLQTAAGRKEGEERALRMKRYLDDLLKEINVESEG